MLHNTYDFLREMPILKNGFGICSIVTAPFPSNNNNRQNVATSYSKQQQQMPGPSEAVMDSRNITMKLIIIADEALLLTLSTDDKKCYIFKIGD